MSTQIGPKHEGTTMMEAHRRAVDWLKTNRGATSRLNHPGLPGYDIIIYPQPGIGGYVARITAEDAGVDTQEDNR